MKKVNEMNKEEFQAFLMEQREQVMAERKRALLELWENLPTFERPDQVPPLPNRIPPDEWKEFYVKKLIGAGAIPKEDLKDGGYYLGEHRRATVARWNGERGVFEYCRWKFGNRFIDQCNHFEDDDDFALFVPISEATEEQFERNAE
jgi:hypothetical protein